MVYKSSPCLGNGAHDMEIALNGKIQKRMQAGMGPLGEGRAEELDP